MKRYYRPDLEKTLSGDVLYVAVEKNGSEQLNQQSCDCNRLMIVIPERRGDIREKLFNSRGRIKYSWTAHRDFAEIEPPDENGNIICARSTYREAVETQENDIYCFYKDGKTFERRFWFGLADADGNTLLPPEFEMIRYLGHGFYACEKGARTTVFKYQKQDLN